MRVLHEDGAEYFEKDMGSAGAFACELIRTDQLCISAVLLHKHHTSQKDKIQYRWSTRARKQNVQMMRLES